MNIATLKSGWTALRAGEALEDPALWKQRGEKLKLALGTFILALNPVVQGITGHDLGITPAVSGAIATFVVWLVGLFFTAATTDKVSVGELLGKPLVAGTPGQPVASRQGPSDSPLGGEPTNAGAPVAVRAGSDDPAQSNPLAGGA